MPATVSTPPTKAPTTELEKQLYDLCSDYVRAGIRCKPMLFECSGMSAVLDELEERFDRLCPSPRPADTSVAVRNYLLNNHIPFEREYEIQQGYAHQYTLRDGAVLLIDAHAAVGVYLKGTGTMDLLFSQASLAQLFDWLEQRYVVRASTAKPFGWLFGG